MVTISLTDGRIRQKNVYFHKDNRILHVFSEQYVRKKGDFTDIK